MHILKTRFLVVIVFFCCDVLTAQVTVPAYTGYAIPVEESTGEDESVLFNEKAGLHNWSNTGQQLQYYFKLRNRGELVLSCLVKNATPGSTIKIAVAGKSFLVNIPQSKVFRKLAVGSVTIPHTGFYSITLTPLGKAGKTIADIQSLILTGAATKDIQFNNKPRRNAASVHLLYPIPDTSKAILFYNEVTIPKDADVLHTYYMTCGFGRGYFGMQVNSATERRIIFSVWDAGKEASDRAKVSEEDKVKLVGKGANVLAEGFGNEGTGGHSHWVYHWKAGETYKFLVAALPDSAGNSTTYSGYFFIPELKKWKLIAAFKAPKDNHYLNGLYSFVENFWGVNGQLYRKALFGNQWIRNENGVWDELTAAKFSYDATGKAGDRIDYGGGCENGKFYLWNGGFQPADAQLGDVFLRKASGENPVIDLYQNADSLQQAEIDKQMIFEAIAAGKKDTIASKDGVYYKILKEGTGPQVTISDTVVVFYKGSLLNGETFDQTTDKPATLPLRRLIKGWQVGLQVCKVGGKIQLIIPSAMAYCIRTRSSKIPPNSVLVFDIEVVDAKR
jgi:hypothetical protein